jgi:choline dehydrogenase-like flavoprotein
VGRYFMDHPGAIPCGVLLFSDPAYHRLGREKEVDGIRVLCGIALREAVLEREQLLSNAMYMRPPMTVQEVRDFEWFNIVQEVSESLDAADMELIRLLARLDPGTADAKATLCWIRSEQAPNPDSRVVLGEERDALGQRRVVLDWRLSELNRHTFEQAARLYARILTRTGIGRVKLVPWLQEVDDAWWRRVTPGWHHIGTTRMADDPSRGVVDPSCRVFGLDDLYIAGSSVFPTSSYINPTLTLVALAIRLADRLREELA